MNARLLSTLFAVSILFGPCTDGYTQDAAGKRRLKSPSPCWTIDAMADFEPSKTHLDFEYALYFPNDHLPKGIGKDFHWESLPEGTRVESRPLLRVDGGQYIEFYYVGKPEGEDRESYLAVLLCFKTEEGWQQPVIVSYPEAKWYESEMVSNSKHPLAFTLKMSLSGTAAIRARWLFDLRGTRRLIAQASAGRMKVDDPPSAKDKAIQDEIGRAWSKASGE